MKTDEKFMRRCIQLAKNGLKNAMPNPMVGAVIVAADGRIIGEGYHVRCGEGHAEVNAFASVKAEDERLLSEATIYVCLEPCAHYGKTPPCADLIVSKGVKRCVVGCVDPFAKVQGRGIEKLQRAGIEVTVGVLEQECRDLNKRFFTYHQLHRPFITLKWAQTAEGKIGVTPLPTSPEGEENGETRLIISNRYTQMLCHKRRGEHQAILVGSHTMETDQPSLTVRDWVGENPKRFVLSHRNGGIEGVLAEMYAEGIQSLLVEGGRQTLQSFIDAGCWEEGKVEKGGTRTLPLAPPKGGEYIPCCQSEEYIYAPVLHDAVLTGSETFFGHTILTFVHSGNVKKL